MPQLLFVDACIRKEKSRTLQLCNAFMDEFLLTHPGWNMVHLPLSTLSLPPFDDEILTRRDDQIAKGELNAPAFQLAHQFANADLIVVGAPYWDLSFPAILKLYIEYVSVCGITFRYNNDWLEGMCKANSLVYVTSSGGPLENINFGYDYFRGLCQQFGIRNCDLLTAQNLDRDYSDVGAIMSIALQDARDAAKRY